MKIKKTTYEELQELCNGIGYKVKINSTTTHMLQTYLRNAYNIDVEVIRNTWSTDNMYYGRFNVKVLRELKEVCSDAGFIKWEDAFKHGLRMALVVVNNRLKREK